jgi:hypothetical protein
VELLWGNSALGACKHRADLLQSLLASTMFRRRYKFLLMGLMLLCCVMFAWFSLSLPSAFSSNALIPGNKVTIVLSATLGGAFLG